MADLAWRNRARVPAARDRERDVGDARGDDDGVEARRDAEEEVQEEPREGRRRRRRRRGRRRRRHFRVIILKNYRRVVARRRRALAGSPARQPAERVVEPRRLGDQRRERHRERDERRDEAGPRHGRRRRVACHSIMTARALARASSDEQKIPGSARLPSRRRPITPRRAGARHRVSRRRDRARRDLPRPPREMGNRMSTATPDAGPAAPPGPRASPNPLGGDVPMTKEREDELRRRFSPDGGEKGGKKKGGERGGAAARSPYRAHQGEILLDTRNEARPHRLQRSRRGRRRSALHGEPAHHRPGGVQGGVPVRDVEAGGGAGGAIPVLRPSRAGEEEAGAGAERVVRVV